MLFLSLRLEVGRWRLEIGDWRDGKGIENISVWPLEAGRVVVPPAGEKSERRSDEVSECIAGSNKTRRLDYQWLNVSWRHGIDHKEFKGRSSRIGKGFSWCNSREEPGVSDLWEKRHARG